jgi:hypothetical protein
MRLMDGFQHKKTCEELVPLVDEARATIGFVK